MNAGTNREDVSVVLALLNAAGRVERRLDRVLSSVRGVSFSEYHLLRELSRMHQESATRVDLAAAVGLTPSAVTRALKPLEKMGYVVTEKSDRDARRSLASLTPAGRDLLADAQGVVDDSVGLMELGSPDQAAIAKLLDKLEAR